MRSGFFLGLLGILTALDFPSTLGLALGVLGAARSPESCFDSFLDDEALFGSTDVFWDLTSGDWVRAGVLFLTLPGASVVCFGKAALDDLKQYEPGKRYAKKPLVAVTIPAEGRTWMLSISALSYKSGSDCQLLMFLTSLSTRISPLMSGRRTPRRARPRLRGIITMVSGFAGETFTSVSAEPNVATLPTWLVQMSWSH